MSMTSLQHCDTTAESYFFADDAKNTITSTADHT